MRSSLVITLVSAMSWPVHAQPAGAEAEVLFRQGKELMAAGKIAEACTAFDASQKLDPTTPTLLNQANCRQQNGQLATAWGLFLETARQTRAGKDKASQQMYATATARAATLEPRLSTLRVDVPADSRVDGLEILRNGELLDRATWNQALPIDGGTYRISARAPGNAEWSSSIVIAGERDAKIIEIPKLRATKLGAVPDERSRERSRVAPTPAPGTEGPRVAPAPAPTVARSRVAPARSAEGSSVARAELWSTRRQLAVGVAGGGVLALAAGGVLGVLAKSKQHDTHALCPDPQLACDSADRANELVRSGHNFAVGADVAFGVGAAAVMAAGVLWFTGAPESHRGIAVVPSAASGQVLVTASGSF